MTALQIKTPAVFKPLLEPSRYKGAYGGRGSGKSHFFGELGVERCILKPGTRMVCIREVQRDLKDSAKHLIETKIEKFGLGHLFKPLEAEIRTPGGGLIIFRGMKDYTATSIKSLEDFDIAWVEEAQTLSAKSLEMLRPTIRKPGSEIWASWNPTDATDPVDALLRGSRPPKDAIVVSANYMDNPFFPAELEGERLHDMQNNPDRYAHIWLGDYEPVAVGAIWTRQRINQTRWQDLNNPPKLKRILVSVDPAVSAEAGSDEHGIIIGGDGEDGHGYLLDDWTMRGTPRQWAVRAVAAFDRFEADAIVVERNQGGDMVKHTLESVRPGIPVIEVVATRGKHVRAEPIASLYEVGRIHHVGTFPELEAQMCKMTAAGYEGTGSPDRVDAMVWLFSELFPQITAQQKRSVVDDRPRRIEGSWMG